MNTTANKDAITAQTLRALIIDDTRLSQHVIQQQLLEGGYEHIRCIESPKEIRHHIETFAPNIILLDWMMPGVNGLSITRMIRAQDKIKQTHTYVFMITGKDDQESMMQAFQEGVDDFIPKSAVSTQLIPRMLRAQKMLNQFYFQRQHINALTLQVAQQKRLMTLDPVSKLPTHRGFQMAFNKAVDSASARNHGLSCMLVQISNYQDLKNRLPTPPLHRVIQHFTERLLKLYRPSDFVARTGVDEFAILMQHGKDQITSLDRVERALDNFALKTKDGYHIIEINTANAHLQTETFADEWNETQLRQYLRRSAQDAIPLSNRLRLTWPHEDPIGRTQHMEDYIFAAE